MRPAVPTAAAALALGLAFVACGGGDDLAENLLEDQINDALGSEGDFDLDIGQDASLPEGFPDDVPVPSLDVQSSTSAVEGGEQIFSVAFVGGGDVLAVADGLRNRFRAQGWDVGDDFSQEADGMRTEGFNASQGDREAVVIVSATQDGQVAVSMVVNQPAG
ncbi:MAG: hypothetical protein R3249_07540 [Nitriliruptorales bacterium]|nr:hypothetical protein [Nitriliruptorales bacterium]